MVWLVLALSNSLGPTASFFCSLLFCGRLNGKIDILFSLRVSHVYTKVTAIKKKFIEEY